MNTKIYPFGLYGDWQYYWSDQAYLKGMKLGSQLAKSHDLKLLL